MSRVTSVTTVIEDGTGTEASRPATSWAGFVHVRVTTPDFNTALDLFIADAQAHALVEQIMAALATPAPVAVSA